MAYAIIRSGGKQFRVEEGATVRVPSIDKQAGEQVELEALVVSGDGGIQVGSPAVDGAGVKGTVSITAAARMSRLQEEARIRTSAVRPPP